MATNIPTKLDLTDVIIEAMPFSDGLVEWCRKHPNFKAGLKFANSGDFLALGLILTSTVPHIPDNEVIGFLVYDMKTKIFKQDFIINVGRKNNEFILYSKRPDKNYDKYSQHINAFNTLYGQNGKYYKNVHHYTIDEAKALNDSAEYQERLASTLSIAAKIELYGPNTITQEMLRKAIDGIRASKQNGHVTWLPKKS